MFLQLSDSVAYWQTIDDKFPQLAPVALDFVPASDAYGTCNRKQESKAQSLLELNSSLFND